MNEWKSLQAQVTGGWWAGRLKMNAAQAIFYQWEQLEATNCIQNFRLAAGKLHGVHEGFFFADSDAYKWLDAAARLLAGAPHPDLELRVNELIDLLEAAQDANGYLYTYNQIHFPGQRWVNLQIEHELYCLGHLIEAGVSHYLATGQIRLLKVARKAADLLARDFKDRSPDWTDGHEEIELALIRLGRATGHRAYFELARQLVERRGRGHGYGGKVLGQMTSMVGRMRQRNEARGAFLKEHPAWRVPAVAPRNPQKITIDILPRFIASLVSGKYTQSHAPIREQTEPVGHSVRLTYLQTAAVMLAREGLAPDLAQTSRRVWERMVCRRMYVTGGLGSLPVIEGFGRDYELDPELAYAETCAALGSIFWNDELALLTGGVEYDDLIEWQLYNASAVGMGFDGHCYLYNNPLATHGGVKRSAWYDVPCCPSNLSRTWASLGNYLYAYQPGVLRVRQFVTSRAAVADGVRVEQESGFPWNGSVTIRLSLDAPQRMRLEFRVPSWASEATARLNGEPVMVEVTPAPAGDEPTACGFDPRQARLACVTREWQDGDALAIEFNMAVRLLRQDRRVSGCAGKVAATRGPLVYCLESVDTPQVFDRQLAGELTYNFRPDLFGGTGVLSHAELVFIPYALWGNRGPAQMNVFFEAPRSNQTSSQVNHAE